MAIYKKYAWLPTKVKTWRPRGSYAIVWMQEYYICDDREYSYCMRIGKFSKEL
jgi:hypothetical protein